MFIHFIVMEFQDIVKNLELFYENHMNYNQSCTDFQTWLTETKQALRNVHDLSGTKDDVDGKLGQILVSFFPHNNQISLF